MYRQVQQMMKKRRPRSVRLPLRNAMCDGDIAQPMGARPRRKRKHIRGFVLAAILPIEAAKACTIAQKDRDIAIRRRRRCPLQGKRGGALYLLRDVWGNRFPGSIFDDDL